jgi:hypothetical protein
MKINDIIVEMASSGSTSSGSIAATSNTIGKMQKRNKNGTAINALDQDNIFGTDSTNKGIYKNSIKTNK